MGLEKINIRSLSAQTTDKLCILVDELTELFYSLTLLDESFLKA